MAARAVTLVEVGPRDGLQNEPGFIPTSTKLALIARLVECGFTRIEATAFVAPARVPQMADHDAVMRGLPDVPGVRFSVLVPNDRGAIAALDAGAEELAVFTAASETFCQKNIRCSIEDSLARFVPVLMRAKACAVPVRGYVSCVTHCPYDGPVAPGRVAEVARALLDLGCYEIALGETLGRGAPHEISAMLDAVGALVPMTKLAGHFHDTGGQALANVETAWDRGISVFDGAIAGLGGCPYAPGASGNVASEALEAHFRARAIKTGLFADRLRDAAEFAQATRPPTP